MIKDIKFFQTRQRGIEGAVRMANSRSFIPPESGEDAYFPATLMAALLASSALGMFAHGMGIGTFDETKDNSGTIAWTADGLELKSAASPSANDDIALNGIFGHQLAQDEAFVFTSIFKLSNLASGAGVGVTGGLVTLGSTELFTADPADGVFFYVTPGTTILKLRTIAASGTHHDQTIKSDLVADTLYRVTFRFKVGATLAQSWGVLYIGEAGDQSQGTEFPFTAAQLADVFAFLSSPPTLATHFGQRVKSTTQRETNIIVAAGMVG